jgi:multidrug efflux pump subunit AcrB
MRPDLDQFAGPVHISFLCMAGGPPTFKPISVKVRGEEFAKIKQAAAQIKDILKAIPGVIDISDDAHRGRMEIVLKLNLDAVRRAGLDPVKVARAIRLMVDGELVTSMQDRGEKVEVCVSTFMRDYQDIDSLLRFGLPLGSGGQIPLSELVHRETMPGSDNMRHYNFRRAITVEAELDKTQMDTITANGILLKNWNPLADRYPNISLDLTGELDDIQESLDSMAMLFLLGIGLIYLILGTQFRSYWQPLMVLATVPLAFVGVVLGLGVTGNPLSLYTLYGVIALAGITVNTAIVLISAANERRKKGMGVIHATVYAARRRIVPVFVTSLTTVVGMFSLSAGLAGDSEAV